MNLESDIPSLPRSPRAQDLVEPRIRQGFRGILRTFSPAERLALYTCIVVAFVSGLILVAEFNARLSREIPTNGGALVEGAVGTPRFVNPILAVSPIDLDLSILVYSGLLRTSFTEGYIPDLAEGYEISEDGTTYTFHIREGARFHDGTPLSSADVQFTVAMAQHPDVKSPRRADWEGVQIQTPDERTVIFTLPHAYAPFLENLTLGILPKKLWETVPPEEFPFSSLNTHPVGSGPYQVADIRFDSTGAPDAYTFRAFKHFSLGEPHITKLVYRAFPTVDDRLTAYEDGDIDSFVADAPKNLSRDIASDIQRMTLARSFGIFFNQNRAPVLSKAEVRAALDAALVKETIVETVLGGYGTPIQGPIPPGLITLSSASSTPRGIDAARDILSRNGWKFSTASSSEGVWTKGSETISMTLATADTEELVESANAVAEAWKAVGIPTSVQVYPLTEFNQTILRPRNFDAILFGEVVGRSLDLYAFWHSSQRNDPGLNLALYTSASADKSLAAARAETNTEARAEHVREFVDTLATDRPAIFLYAPEIGYLIPAHVHGVELGTLTHAADRFATIHTWYRDTERVWNVFTD